MVLVLLPLLPAPEAASANHLAVVPFACGIAVFCFEAVSWVGAEPLAWQLRRAGRWVLAAAGTGGGSGRATEKLLCAVAAEYL